MKKIIIALITIIGCIMGLMVYANTENSINAEIVNYRISYAGSTINNNLQNPLISYNNHTYISIRDVGWMTSKNILWNSEDESITFAKFKTTNYLIKEKKTAQSIGKALAEERYSERINENTKYYTGFTLVQSASIEDFYTVYIMFNPPADRELDMENENDLLFMLNECDIRLNISPIDGNFRIDEKQLDGLWKRIDVFNQ